MKAVATGQKAPILRGRVSVTVEIRPLHVLTWNREALVNERYGDVSPFNEWETLEGIPLPKS